MKRGGGARSGSRPRRRFRARRSRVCRTWWRRRGTGGAGRKRARRCCAAYRQPASKAGGRPPRRAAPEPVLHLVRGLGDGGLDPAAAQVGADRGAGVGLVAQHPPGAGPGPARAPARDLELAHQGHEGHRVVALPGAGQAGQRPAPGVSEQVDLAGQPTSGPAQRLPVFVIRLTPRGAPERSAQPAPAAPDPHRRAAHAAPRPRTGAPAPPWHRPRPSTPRPAASSHPARSRPRIISHVPSPDQRRCRLYTVFQFPNRSGRSRHGHPVRVRKKIPSITSR